MKSEGFAPDLVRLSLEAEIVGANGQLSSVVQHLSSTAAIDPRFLQAGQGSVELLRLRATTSMPHNEVLQRAPNGHSLSEAVKGHRDTIWGRVSDLTTLYTWEALRPGHEASGGTILESAWTTSPVLPEWSLRVDENANGHLRRR